MALPGSAPALRPRRCPNSGDGELLSVRLRTRFSPGEPPDGTIGTRPRLFDRAGCVGAARSRPLSGICSGGRTPLHMAAASGNAYVVHWLILHGADLDARNNAGGTPLHTLAYSDQAPDAARVLVENGADIHAKDCDGWTPLHKAAFWWRAAAVRLLVELGADLRATDNDGKTALDLSLEEGHSALARSIEQATRAR